MKKCNNCNHLINDESITCPVCGSQTFEEIVEAASAPVSEQAPINVETVASTPENVQTIQTSEPQAYEQPIVQTETPVLDIKEDSAPVEKKTSKLPRIIGIFDRVSRANTVRKRSRCPRLAPAFRDLSPRHAPPP